MHEFYEKNITALRNLSIYTTGPCCHIEVYKAPRIARFWRLARHAFPVPQGGPMTRPGYGLRGVW